MQQQLFGIVTRHSGSGRRSLQGVQEDAHGTGGQGEAAAVTEWGAAREKDRPEIRENISL
jgi:hypothetical protein